jgi:hypothetical protein
MENAWFADLSGRIATIWWKNEDKSVNCLQFLNVLSDATKQPNFAAADGLVQDRHTFFEVRLPSREVRRYARIELDWAMAGRMA